MADKKPKATHQGNLELNGINISCAVLNDGTRVISERSLALALGIRGGGAYWEKKKNSDNEEDLMPEYLSTKNVQKFISEALRIKLSKPIIYIPKTPLKDEKSAKGFEADILPEICDIWINADKLSALSESQKKVASNAYTILKGFAKIGIISLVDEATGYQYDRERFELQKILKAYISEELLVWQQRFPHEFYKQIFRLNNWDYTPANLKARPGVIGTWTNNYVYKQLPKGVLEELKKKTPIDQDGNRKHQFHRLLTQDTGHPHLDKQLTQVITIMKLSKNWKDFIRKFNQLFGQTSLPFDEE